MPPDLGRVSADYLAEYVDRLQRAVAALPPADTWWAPHAAALSVGNILTHLDGNVRQWILSGIGQAPDGRDRAAEFSTTAGAQASELLTDLSVTVEAAREVIAGMGADDMQGSFEIQGNRISGWEAVYHVIEHFSWHTGQVVWIAKYRAGDGHGLAFFDDAKINAQQNRRPSE